MFPFCSFPDFAFQIYASNPLSLNFRCHFKSKFFSDHWFTKVRDYLTISHQARGTCRYPTLSPTLRLNICSGYHRTSFISIGSTKYFIFDKDKYNRKYIWTNVAVRCTFVHKNHIKAGDNKGYLKTRDFGSFRIHWWSRINNTILLYTSLTKQKIRKKEENRCKFYDITPKCPAL